MVYVAHPYEARPTYARGESIFVGIRNSSHSKGLQELYADLSRQQRIQQSALQLEEQYQAERQENKLLPEAPKTTGGDASSYGKLEAGVEGTTTSIPSKETIEKRKRRMAP